MAFGCMTKTSDIMYEYISTQHITTKRYKIRYSGWVALLFLLIMTSCTDNNATVLCP